MSAVTKAAFHHNRVEAPAELRDLRGWLVWRLVSLDGEEKPRKVPFYVTGEARTGKQGSPLDREKLTTFAAARDAAIKGNYAGVGLALMPEFGITALDFDNCVDADGNVPLEVEAIVANTYAEYSPSGQGVRAFVKGDYGNRKAKTENGLYGFETFSSKGFVTFTGQVLPVVELIGHEDTVSDKLGERVQALCDARFKYTSSGSGDNFMDGYEPRLGLTIRQMDDILDHLDPDMGRDEWIRVGMGLHHETEGGDDGLHMWNEWSEGSSKYPGEEALQAQWDSFTRRAGPGQRQVTLASAIRMAKENGYVHRRDSDVVTATELQERILEERQRAADQPPRENISTPKGFHGEFAIYSLEEISQRPPPEWLIKGVVPQAPLVIAFGASGSGKSFGLIDMLAAIGRGEDWRGRKTKRGRCLYIAAEGAGGVAQRVRAYCQHHRVPASSIDMGVMTAAPNFMNKDDISEIAVSIEAAGGNFSVIVVDTLAQVTPGANENTAEDMGKALANARALHEATGAVIILIHHAGKDLQKGSRGWSGLKAAADAELEFVKHESGARQMRTSKMKDGDDGLSWDFKLEVVELGKDEDGDPITSCVAVETDPPALEQKESKGIVRYGSNERHILEMIETIEKDITSMKLDAFVTLCASALPDPGGDVRDNRRAITLRAIRSLAKATATRPDPPIEINTGRVIFMI